MSFDLFMNDTCSKCRKPITLAPIELHPTRRDLAVHKFQCTNCGSSKTKMLFRRPSEVAA
jgi:hypothetical protein